jgi:DNA-binding XRE family transcriptional regulator
MPSKQPQYQINFNKALKQFMIDQEFETVKDAAGKLKIEYQTLNKIYTGGQEPRIKHCIILCNAGKFSANWMFLNKGDMRLGHQATLNEIYNIIKKK